MAPLPGTARRWSSGEPSLPVALITRYKMAGPGAVLDEIEKAGTSRHNGQVHDALLAYLERETACRFHDPYVQAPCDLSHVTWLMTANSLESLSAPLRDRCRVIQFPEPGREDLPVLIRQITADILADQGLDQRWIIPLDDVELAAIEEAWPGGSLRTLEEDDRGGADLPEHEALTQTGNAGPTGTAQSYETAYYSRSVRASDMVCMQEALKRESQ